MKVTIKPEEEGRLVKAVWDKIIEAHFGTQDRPRMSHTPVGSFTLYEDSGTPEGYYSLKLGDITVQMSQGRVYNVTLGGKHHFGITDFNLSRFVADCEEEVKLYIHKALPKVVTIGENRYQLIEE